MAKAALKVVEKPDSAEDLQARLQLEQAARDAAVAELEQLQEQRTEFLIDGDDQAVIGHDAAIAHTQRAVERHTLRAERLEKQFAEAEAAAAEAERLAEHRARYERAKDLVDRALAFVHTEYDSHASAVRAGLLLLEEADREAEKINADLPEGEAALPIPSCAFHVSATNGRKEVVRERVWVNSMGERLMGAVSIGASGKPNVLGARQITVDVERTTRGDLGWRPLPLYELVGELPSPRRDGRPYWPK